MTTLKFLVVSVFTPTLSLSRTNLSLELIKPYFWASLPEKGWKLLDLDIKKFITSRDVEFQESIFPYDITAANVTPPPTRTKWLFQSITPLNNQKSQGPLGWSSHLLG